MRIDIISIFPKILDSYLNESIINRARGQKFLEVVMHDLRDYSHDAHKTVDDKPYGGGAGMVMKPDPWFEVIEALPEVGKRKVILMTPRGKSFSQKIAKQLTKYDQLVFVCGRYEGIDERVHKLADMELSIGPYVLAGGELPAMIVTEAVARLIPGVLGSQDSLSEESHTQEGVLEYPQYTRPEVFRGKRVPKVLLSGDHKKIQKWRSEQSAKISGKAG